MCKGLKFDFYVKLVLVVSILYTVRIYLLRTRGVSLKNTAKNKINNVPINKKVYTRASIFFLLIC